MFKKRGLGSTQKMALFLGMLVALAVAACVAPQPKASQKTEEAGPKVAGSAATPVIIPTFTPIPTSVPTSLPTSTPLPRATDTPTATPAIALLTPTPTFTPTVVKVDSTPTSSPTPVSSPTPSPTIAPVRASPASNFGLGYGMQLDPGTDFPKALNLVRAAGFNWVKIQVRWEDLERTRGNIQWDFFDYAVNTSQSYGVRLLFSVVTTPAWARPRDTDLSVPGPPADPEDFARFVGAIAARYPGKIHAYEIWNEQNLAREWGGNGRQSAQEYVALLKSAYKAIKNVDPGATILSGALTPAGTVDLGQGVLAIDDVFFFRQMYQAGMSGFFDGVAAHPSGFNNAPDLNPQDPAVLGRPGSFRSHRSFYFRNFERYQEIMVEYGDADKQIWFTEFGWAAGPNPAPEYAYAVDNSEENQANYLTRAFAIAKERGYVGPMFVWNLNFAPSADQADWQGKRVFSIINPDWSPRPAYTALTAMPKP